MTKYLVIYALAMICGIIIGLYIGLYRADKHASDGICMRADDGEVYLRMSEAGQLKLADPSTKMLILKVVDVSTRNNQLL